MSTLCFKDQETVSYILCRFSHIAQSLYKERNDRMLRLVYHALLERYQFEMELVKRRMRKTKVSGA